MSDVNASMSFEPGEMHVYTDEPMELPVLTEIDMDLDGQLASEGDCNDDDATIYSGAPDLTEDGIDQDAMGLTDALPMPTPMAFAMTSMNVWVRLTNVACAMALVPFSNADAQTFQRPTAIVTETSSMPSGCVVVTALKTSTKMAFVMTSTTLDTSPFRRRDLDVVPQSGVRNGPFGMWPWT